MMMSDHNTWTIPEPKADYIILSKEEYNRRLEELEEVRAELARLRELVQWQPVEDGVYETQHDGDQVEVSGEWLTVREKDILDPTDSFIADVALPDGIRLCRRNPNAQPQPASVPDEVREALAEYAHEAWSGWMRYLFSKGEYGWADGPVEANRLPERVWMMPAWAVQRWTRQMQTPYSQLPEEEKDSDRKEADRMLEIVRRWLDAQPASVPDGEVLDWLKRLVLARENEMLCYIQRYNYEENSTQLATCRAALAWLDAQPQPASVPDDGR